MSTTARILAIAPLRVNNCCSRWLPAAILWLLVLLVPSVLAAPPLAIDRQTSQQRLEAHMDVLDNADGLITADTILLPVVNRQFLPLPQTTPGALSAFSDNLWLRFVLINHSPADELFWFVASHRSVQRASLYRVSGDRLQLLDEAPLHNAGSAPILKSVTVPASRQSTFYLHLEGRQSHAVQPQLMRPAVFFNDSLSSHRQMSFGIGMLLFNALLCLLLALTWRSRLFFYQAGFVFSVAMVQLAGIGLPELTFSLLHRWQYAVAFFFVYGCCVTVLQLARENLRQHDMPWRQQRRLDYLLWFTHAAFAMLLLTSSGYSPLILPIIGVVAGGYMAAGFYCYSRTGDRHTLAITLVKLLNMLVLAGYFFYSDSWMFVQLIDPVVLYCMVVETGLVSLLYISSEFHRLSAARDKRQLLNDNSLRQQARAALFGEISHDIRTPVSNIIGVTALLKNSQLSAGQGEKVDMISESAQQMLNKLAELQARIDVDGPCQHIQHSPFELVRLVEACVQGFQVTAESRSSELIMQIQPDVPDIVYGDQARLRQILLQLIGNAVRRTEQGEVIVSVSRQASNPDAITVVIKDSGRQPDMARTRGGQLADQESDPDMLDQLLLSMGSALEQAADDSGNRFAFTVILPAMQAPAAVLDDNNALQRKRLLVVDDNHASCKVLKQLAGSWGMQVSEAFDASRAIALVRARQNLGEPFDVLIIDHDMPQISGLELARRLQGEQASPPLMIMLTGVSNTPDEASLRDAGIAAVLNKPASAGLIRASLLNLLRLHAGNTAEQRLPCDCKLLVAEDNDVGRRVISKMLDSLGVQYRLVANGQLALDAIQRDRFDLILMDCEMPLMDGLEATRAIHRWQQQRGEALTPVVAMTAYSMESQRRQSRAAGMVGFLDKPVQLPVLRRLIAQYCQH